ncbi:hypothetical protein HB779_05390 [Phyllobacterium sp. 628]|uniref:DUF5680 domain-containing protein n=1 Tax=Phyllobacterium sp. 628 TaxID=2718938 RepID=UPI0016624753|nr:DUF5680 domain-containing protein [Phyllobacterium sp. 628]QND54075.1 hypothetical protein HB779_05390 [Phyllobacterium sp. 628]
MLERFIVEAKAAAYVGNGSHQGPCRMGSHDIGYQQGEWRYLDSYFGGTDFLGQEIVWKNAIPVWAMNYYGRILQPDMINAQIAGSIIREALSSLYREGRFLGGFRYEAGAAIYVDATDGDVGMFHGIERIFIREVEVYRLDYHGGLIRP